MADSNCAQQNGGNKNCPCTYTSCSKHGNCCQCVAYHSSKDQLPACYFTAEQEKTYNRNIDYFIECRTK